MALTHHFNSGTVISVNGTRLTIQKRTKLTFHDRVDLDIHQPDGITRRIAHAKPPAAKPVKLPQGDR